MKCPYCHEGELMQEDGTCTNPLCDQGFLMASPERADAMRDAIRKEVAGELPDPGTGACS